MKNGRACHPASGRAALCVLLLSCVAALAPSAGRAAGGRAQEERVDIRMRSFAPPSSGRVTVEASEGGGRARVTALSLPDPQTVGPGSRTYVVWAIGDGRITNLGELRRDERGNGGLAFERPAGFERYSVVVTAEASAAPARPGSPVLSTRAGEVGPLYPPPVSGAAAATTPADATPPAGETDRPAAAAPSATTPAATPAQPAAAQPTTPAPRRRFAARRARGEGFYGEVDAALAEQGGGRAITLDGEQLAPDARGEARAALRAGQAYVRADFHNVPLPSAVGAEVFVLWGIIPDGRIVYMGSLPAGDALNLGETYVRTAGFDTDDFTLFVTAERQRPAPSPSGRRVLTPKSARLIVK
jgi:hypothetical protein